MSYTLDIPNAPNNPSKDQPLMKANTNAINTLIGVDHVSFNTANSGYHKVIHQILRTSNPAAIAGINQVYAKNYTPNATNGVTDTQLFNRTGIGTVTQMTGLVAGNEGYAWMGGMLIQWGSVSFPPGQDELGGIVTFKDRDAPKLCIDFPNDIFVVQMTLKSLFNGTTSSTASNTLGIYSESRFTFEWKFTSSNSNGSTRWPGFYWLAVGN